MKKADLVEAINDIGSKTETVDYYWVNDNEYNFLRGQDITRMYGLPIRKKEYILMEEK